LVDSDLCWACLCKIYVTVQRTVAKWWYIKLCTFFSGPLCSILLDNLLVGPYSDLPEKKPPAYQLTQCGRNKTAIKWFELSHSKLFVQVVAGGRRQPKSSCIHSTWPATPGRRANHGLLCYYIGLLRELCPTHTFGRNYAVSVVNLPVTVQHDIIDLTRKSLPQKCKNVSHATKICFHSRVIFLCLNTESLSK